MTRTTTTRTAPAAGLTIATAGTSPRRPELLAPAGNVEKLKTALDFGADAVYLGLEHLSLRRFASNFTPDELEWALDHAHGLARKVYVAVNILPFDEDFARIEETLGLLEQLRPDGVIVADPGVLALARTLAPSVPPHLSTQMSVSSAPAARFWFAQGVRRICVARELSIAQLGAIVDGAGGAGGEIEAFVHGAVCIAYSGRCFLSLYWAGRDPRRGECAQACRWPYREIEDRRRPGAPNVIEEDERGTYFFDAKDLCALPVLDRLVSSGVAALKIEGRTRSEHYVAAVVDVYRDALDRLAAGDVDGFHARRAAYEAELARPTSRGFSTHFLDGDEPGPEAYNPEGSRLAHENAYLGKVTRRGEDFLEVALRNPVRPGDVVEVRDRGLRSTTVTVPAVRDTDGTLLDYGRSPRTVRLMVTVDATPGALVRLAGAATDPPIGPGQR